MIYEQNVQAVNPVELAMLTGITRVPRFSSPVPPVIRPFLLTHQLRGCACDGGMAVPPDYGRLRGLGLDVNTLDLNNLQVPSAGSGNISALQTIALGANFIPGVGQIASVAMTTVTTMLNQFQSWFGIGAGRREADVIVPVQNNLVYNALSQITNQISLGQNPSTDVLASLYRQVWILAVSFQEFVLQRQFTDRRASGQALNTVMPYIDGSCGYAVPAGFTETPSSFSCGLTWGDNTVGGPGQNGMLGAIGRALVRQGSSVPTLPDLHQAANSGIRPTSIDAGGFPTTIMGVSTPLAFIIGGLALFAYKRGLF